MARHHTLDYYQDKVDDLLKCLEIGMSDKAACEYASFSKTIFYEYLSKAQEDEEAGKETKFTKFADKVKKAKSKFKMRHMARITQAADDGSWQASAWLLERRAPDEFALRSQVDLSDSKIVVISDVPEQEEEES